MCAEAALALLRDVGLGISLGAVFDFTGIGTRDFSVAISFDLTLVPWHNNVCEFLSGFPRSPNNSLPARSDFFSC